MTEQKWADVDAYIADRLVGADDALTEMLAANAAAGLPAIDVSPPQGKLLYLLARMIKAKRVLEIGTLGGYSTVWLARALPDDGIVVTLEVDPHHAEVARANFQRAHVAGQIDLRVGRALDLLPIVAAEGLGPFDLVFIDADKASMPDYIAWALKLSRQGSVIISDNVVREGRVIEAASGDPAIDGARGSFDLMAREPRLDATAIQTVGSKGWDGFALAIVE